MLTLLIGAVMPVVVMFLTNQTKRLSLIEKSNNRVLWIRALVAVLALLGSIATWWIGDGELDQSLFETTVLAVFNAGVATYLYYKTK